VRLQLRLCCRERALQLAHHGLRLAQRARQHDDRLLLPRAPRLQLSKLLPLQRQQRRRLLHAHAASQLQAPASALQCRARSGRAAAAVGSTGAALRSTSDNQLQLRRGRLCVPRSAASCAVARRPLVGPTAGIRSRRWLLLLLLLLLLGPQARLCTVLLLLLLLLQWQRRRQRLQARQQALLWGGHP
jgi:hypothetical protein